MDTQLTVALVAGAIALTSVIWTSIMQRRLSKQQAAATSELELLKHRLSQLAQKEQQLVEAEGVLNHYQRPLLGSAVELKRRVGNIRHNRFLDYVKTTDHRSKIALRSTMYRLTAFFGWREVVNRQLTYLDFADQEHAERVMKLLEDVSTQLARDTYDVDGGHARLMLWKDEQRALGGLMMNADSTAIIGFDTFSAQYENLFEPWLKSFADDLTHSDAGKSQRLERLEGSLQHLIEALDSRRLYSGRV